MDGEVLRRALLELLATGSAHVTVDSAIEGLSVEDAFRRPSAQHDPEVELHSVWELLEHMRCGQEDLLHYTMDSSWVSPPWPEGYWPSLPDDASREQREERWRATVEGFRRDLEEIRGWVRDPNLDLTAEIPHGEGRTYLRSVLLVADHNSYHLGQIISTRRMLGRWS